jgi:hypothetical protein
MDHGRSDLLHRWGYQLRCIAVTSGSPELQITLGSLVRELESTMRVRGDRGIQSSFKAATPGRVLPSSHSRNAPPAVET